MRYFPINNPISGKEQRVYYNNKDDKKELLEKHILDYWSPYCNDHWIWLGKFEEGKWNYEDKVKHFLGRCANFLLIGDYEENDIMSGSDIGRVVVNELSLEGDWQNENMEIDLDDTIDYLNNNEKVNFGRDSKMLETKLNNKPTQPSRKNKSRTSKMLEIYSEEEKEFDDYDEIHISNTFSVWKQTKKTIPTREGLINRSKPYISEWCVVDTDNVFKFNNNNYKISEQVSQYSIRTKKPNHDDYKNDYQMDKILAYEQEGKMYFFDQNVDRIEIDKITRV